MTADTNSHLLIPPPQGEGAPPERSEGGPGGGLFTRAELDKDPTRLASLATLPFQGRDSESGFTLVEVLVALVLLSLLSMTLFSSVRFGVTAWRRGSERSDQIHTSMLVQDLLRRLIGQAYPLVLADGTGTGRVDFAGTATSLEFLAPVPVALASGGRARFKLAIEPRGEAYQLALAARQELAAAEAPAELAHKTLLATLDAAEFAYFGAAEQQSELRWHERWSGEIGLPALVRVRVRFARGDPRLWPDLTIAPRIGADVGCVYDPLTKLCRGR